MGAGMGDRHRRRLDRQLQAMARRFPALRGLIAASESRPGVLFRLPLGMLLLIGGFLGFLPVLGFWMAPLGLMILAIDLPVLRPWVSAVIVRFRRRWALWRRGRRNGRR